MRFSVTAHVMLNKEAGWCVTGYQKVYLSMRKNPESRDSNEQ